MSNVETPMTNEARNQNDESPLAGSAWQVGDSGFVIRHSFVIRASSFDIHAVTAARLVRLNDLVSSASWWPTMTG
jgi:hypothetical protein